MDGDLMKSATSLASVQSSPLASSGTVDGKRCPVRESAVDSPKARKDLDVPKPDTSHQRNSDDSGGGCAALVNEQTEVQVDVHVDDVDNGIVVESHTSGNQPEIEAVKQKSSTNKTFTVSEDTNSVQKIQKDKAAKQNAGTANNTDKSSRRRTANGDHFKKRNTPENKRQHMQSENMSPSTRFGTHDEQQDKAQICKSKIAGTPNGSNNPGSTMPRASPSSLGNNKLRTGSRDAGCTSEAIPLEHLSKDRNDGNPTDEATCPLELVNKLERELFTDDERAMLCQYEKNKDTGRAKDALEHIMTGEFDRDLKEFLHA